MHVALDSFLFHFILNLIVKRVANVLMLQPLVDIFNVGLRQARDNLVLLLLLTSAKKQAHLSAFGLE